MLGFLAVFPADTEECMEMSYLSVVTTAMSDKDRSFVIYNHPNMFT